jgi:uncharacterized protein (TIGR02466 family)
MTTASLQAFAYFPAIVYRDERPEWVDFILSATQKHFDVSLKSSSVVQTGHIADDPDLAFLTDYLVMSSVEILRDQGYEVDRYEFYLSALWGQDVDCNGGTNVHVHKNSQIAGWVFLEVPANGAYPVYHDTRKNKEMVELDFRQGDEISNASTAVHFNNVKPGTVLFANSWMQHQLTNNMSQEKTKSIHFTVSHKEKERTTCSM